MTIRNATHYSDADCGDLVKDGVCRGCGAAGGPPCDHCGGERYHEPGCPDGGDNDAKGPEYVLEVPRCPECDCTSKGEADVIPGTALWNVDHNGNPTGFVSETDVHWDGQEADTTVDLSAIDDALDEAIDDVLSTALGDVARGPLVPSIRDAVLRVVRGDPEAILVTCTNGHSWPTRYRQAEADDDYERGE